LACASLIGTLIAAIRKVHQPHGGWEYNAVLIAALIVLTETSPVSLDRLRGQDDPERAGLWRLGRWKRRHRPRPSKPKTGPHPPRHPPWPRSTATRATLPPWAIP